MIIIRIYQKMISAILPQTCRFYPSCSNYALEALQRKPLHKSLWLILKRLSKCHPFHPGGFDPVP